MDSPQAEAARTLQFLYRDNLYNVDRAHPTLQRGRDDANDIVILSLFASRPGDHSLRFAVREA